MSNDDQSIVLDFIRAEAAFYLEHAKQARALEEVAKNTNDITLKCEKLVELEERARKLAPPSGEMLAYLASEIETYDEVIRKHNLASKPNAPLHSIVRDIRDEYARHEEDMANSMTPEKVRAREATDAEIRALEALLENESTKELMDDMQFSIIRSNVNLPFHSRMKVHDKTHNTIAAHAAYITFNAKFAVDKHRAELTSYNTKYARVHMFKDAAALAKLDRNANPAIFAAAHAHLAAAIRAVNSPAECPICMAADVDCATRCKHVFHRRCIAKWLDGGNHTCPLCRAEIAEQGLTDRV